MAGQAELVFCADSVTALVQNFESVFANRSRHPIDGSIVFSGIPGVEDELVDRPDLDLEGWGCDHAP